MSTVERHKNTDNRYRTAILLSIILTVTAVFPGAAQAYATGPAVTQPETPLLETAPTEPQPSGAALEGPAATEQLTSLPPADKDPVPVQSAGTSVATQSAIVTWDANGGSVAPATSEVNAGEQVGTLPLPARVGYTFSGWTTAKNGGAKVAENTVITANVTFYASWKANTYTVTLNANGGKIGTAKTKNVTFTYDSAGHKLPAPNKDRSFFKGWYTMASGGTKVTESTIYKTPSNSTLYAQWTKATTLTVIYDPQGGKVKPASKKYKYDKNIGKLPTPTRARYDFMGWYTLPRGGKKVVSTTKTGSVKTQITLYARWAPHQYFQYDGRWGGKRYQSSIAGSGCGPSTMSMVVYTLAGKNVNPYVAAMWSMSRRYVTSAPGKTKLPFFTNFPKAYGVKSTKVYSGDLRKLSAAKAKPYHDKAKQAVKDGNWVVCFMAPGNWTHVGHFILWYEIDGDRALVRDPNATKAAKTRAAISLLQRQVKAYWIIEVPDAKKLSPPDKG